MDRQTEQQITALWPQTLLQELAIQRCQERLQEFASARRQYELAMQSHQETARDLEKLEFLLALREIWALENDAADQQLCAAFADMPISDDHYRRPPAWGPHPTITNTEEPSSCVACGENVPAAAALRAPCGDPYCRSCMAQLLKTAISDVTRFPARCCSERIELDDLAAGAGAGALPPDLVARYRTKLLERQTRNKMYCHNHRACGEFIPPEEIQGTRATCTWCWQDTCRLCKTAFHVGPCPKNEAEQATLLLAERQGWKRCSWCQTLVELRDGCHHITCPCGAQFCYVCSKEWKGLKPCDCPPYPDVQSPEP